jgi:hypothetical protein
MIQNDEQMQAAQTAVLNLKNILLEARSAHSPEDYRRMSEPILLELQSREQEIVDYLAKTFVETPASFR